MKGKEENRLRAAGVQFPGAGAVWNSDAKVLIDGLRLAAQRGTNLHGVPTTITLTCPNIVRKNGNANRNLKKRSAGFAGVLFGR